MKSWLPAWIAPSAVLFLALTYTADTRDALEPETASKAREGSTVPVTVSRAVSNLTAWVKENRALAGVVITDLESGEQWARVNAETAHNPASNQKIITAAAALKLLGPGYRFTTGVYGAVVAGVAARLVLRGHGDPTLSTEHIWRLARALKARGVRRVDSLLVDQSRFDDQFVPPAFEQQPNEWASFRAPISAIALERNTVTLNVEGDRAGKPARYWFDPEGFVTARGDIATTETGSGQDIRLTLEPNLHGLQASMSGRVAEGLPRLQFVRRLDDPRLYSGAVLQKLLRELGVQVVGEPALGGADEKRRLVFVESEPLSVLVRELGKNSDNFFAEMLLKTIGAELKGTPATSRAGAQTVMEWLSSLGVTDKAMRIRNGSGLFDANRVSVATLATTLTRAYADPALQAEFVAHLAIGGVDGTLRSRFKKFSAKRVIRAKTGTLEDVIALSGYVLRSEFRPPVVFALVLNGVKGKHAGARERIERVVESIAETLASSP